MKNKAFAYIRVSGKGQIRGDGLARQERAVQKYARQNGIEIVRIFKERGVSGTLKDRPALAEMLINLQENGHGIKTVIIERIDRLARDLMVQEAILSDLKEQGFDLVSVADGADLLSNDPTRKLVRQVLGAIAEYDKEMTVLKLRAARERKRLKYGKCEGRKSYTEVAPEVLAEIKRLRRKPKGRKRITFEKIAEILNKNNYLTPTGGCFTGNNISTILHRQNNAC